MKEINKLETLFKTQIIIVGMIVVMMGGLLNHEVVISNGNKMPVLSGFAFETKTHYGINDLNESTKGWLGDIIKMGTLYLSIGDIIMYSGGLIVIYGITSIGINFMKKEKAVKK